MKIEILDSEKIIRIHISKFCISIGHITPLSPWNTNRHR